VRCSAAYPTVRWHVVSAMESCPIVCADPFGQHCIKVQVVNFTMRRVHRCLGWFSLPALLVGKCISTAAKWVTKWVKGAIRKTSEVSSPIILPLTPAIDAEEFKPYMLRLDAAFRKPEIKNIAVTGMFGAGKSSVLKTYFKDSDVLWVTLAPFIEYAGSFLRGCRPKEKDRLMRILETSILKQMFYTTRRVSLPFSRFLRIVHNDIRVYLFVAITVLLLLGVLFFVVQPSAIWAHLYSISVDSRERLCVFALWISVVPLTIITLFLCDFFRGLKIKGRIVAAATEVEVEGSDKGMSFDRTIDEIIYHFQRLNYRAVVFEDLDRFPGTIIFSKLKEMNHIINESKDICGNKKPIRFVYALRDLVLRDEDRVKFFDYILPIVPVTSIANSTDHFLHSLSICMRGEKLDERSRILVKAVSQYIVDTRLINNICNEFSVYREKLGPDVPYANLLGMIVFKNVIPEEYELLLHGMGSVIDLFTLGNLKIKEEQDSLNLKISEYSGAYENMDVNAEGGSSDERKNEIAKLKKDQCQLGRLSFRNLLKAQKVSMDEYWAVMGYKQEDSGFHIAPIDRKCVKFTERQVNVLYGLLLGGFLDENYKHYLSVFDAEVMTRKDHKFVLSVLRNTELPWDYKLDSVELVRAELGSWLYDRRAALNFDLIKSALLDSDWPSDKREVLLSFVSRTDMGQMHFIDSFLGNYNDSDAFYLKVRECIANPIDSYYNALISSKDILPTRKLLQLGKFLKLEGDLHAIEIPRVVARFITSFANVAETFEHMRFSVADVKDLLGGGRIKFGKINFAEKLHHFRQVFEVILSTDAYEVTSDLMRGAVHMLGYKTDGWDVSSGSIVYLCNNEFLQGRLDADLKLFLERVSFISTKKQTDDPRFIEYVLNHAQTDIDLGKKFLKHQTFGIQDARRIKNNEFVEYAILNDKLRFSWVNAIGYYEKFIEEADIGGGDFGGEPVDVCRQRLCDYIIAGREYFEYCPFDVEYEYDYIFIALLVGCPRIHDSYIRNILENCPNLKSHVCIEDSIPAHRIYLLAQRGMSKFDSETYKRLHELGDHLSTVYACAHMSDFINNASSLNVTAEDLSKILEREDADITVSQAVELSRTFKNLFLEEQCAQKALSRYIKISTLSLFEHKVVCACIKYLTPVATQCYVYSDYSFDRENSIKFLRLMPEPFVKLLNDGAIVTLPKSELVKDMLHKLKERSIVAAYRTIGSEIRVRVVGGVTATVDDMTF